MAESRLVVIGAGPAGLGCAYELGQAGQTALIAEQEDQPGGLCRTVNFNGYLFDIGGHRFLTETPEVRRLWDRLMGQDLLSVKRLSRIYYRRRYFRYPLSFFNTFWNLGAWESAACIASYAWCKALKPADDRGLEGWIINRFGKRLYEIFFDTYNEKIWNIPCRQLSADWAAERIRGLSLRVAIQDALNLCKGKPKTLTEEFLYPRTGPGEFYKRLADLVRRQGSACVFKKEAVRIHRRQDRVCAVDFLNRDTGGIETVPLDYLFSSIPLTELIRIIEPAPPADVRQAAEALSFRSFLVVNIILDKERVFSDQWVYVHSPEVKLCRIQNYKNWSPAMVADFKKTSLGMEYFCSASDALWNMNDIDLIDYAVRDLERIGISVRRHVISGFVIRYKHAYPVYSSGYQAHREVVKGYLKKIGNLQTMGRGGLFRYDHSDRALLSGMHCARNFLGSGAHDVWAKPAAYAAP